MKLSEFNTLSKSRATNLLLACCGSNAWVQEMLLSMPFGDESSMFDAADASWRNRTETDFLEAFSHHPKIGDLDSLREKFASTAHLASSEQGSVASASEEVLQGLAKGNADYERKFGFIFIVCATGKTAAEMLELLQTRLPNSREKELQIAAGEQTKITRIRLEKLLS